MKELYEPLFEELLKGSQSNGFKIRGIWTADVAMQGQSGILNENTMGNDRKATFSKSHHCSFKYR